MDYEALRISLGNIMTYHKAWTSCMTSIVPLLAAKPLESSLISSSGEIGQSCYNSIGTVEEAGQETVATANRARGETVMCCSAGGRQDFQTLLLKNVEVMSCGTK
jgi:hypothetical protein